MKVYKLRFIHKDIPNTYNPELFLNSTELAENVAKGLTYLILGTERSHEMKWTCEEITVMDEDDIEEQLQLLAKNWDLLTELQKGRN
jgi:hypothetical protein